jgi:peptidoglycan/xylan/chitin deacetylase (PgdA/CDA1 family)
MLLGHEEGRWSQRRGLSTMLSGVVLGGAMVALSLAAWHWLAPRHTAPDAYTTTTTAADALLSQGLPRAQAAILKPAPKPTPDPQAIPKWAEGRVINNVPVRRGEKVFALTFDDGPWPVYTHQILKILADYDVKATFFVVGSVLQNYPEIGKAIRDGGHAIGGHSWSHPTRPRDPVAQIKRTNAAIKSILGFTPTFYRPPYGNVRSRMTWQARQEKQAILIWSADSQDWRRPGASRIAATILRQASPGGIALMHDGGGPRGNTVAALPVIIRGLQERGYRFVTIPELLKLRYVPPAKSKQKQKIVPNTKQVRSAAAHVTKTHTTVQRHTMSHQPMSHQRSMPGVRSAVKAIVTP